MKIAIGNDHVALSMKAHVIDYLKALAFEIIDVGTYSDERTDYPIWAKACADRVSSGECELGILICGTGVGMSIAANKQKGIRAVVCSEPYSAMMARAHNDANILCFGARVIGEATAEQLCDAFLSTEYEGGRHQRRVDMLVDFDGYFDKKEAK